MNWLERLRAADEEKKKQWLMIASIIAGIILVMVWGLTLRASVQSVRDSATPAEKHFGFWQSAKSGTALLYRNFSDTIGNLIN